MTKGPGGEVEYGTEGAEGIDRVTKNIGWKRLGYQTTQAGT